MSRTRIIATVTDQEYIAALQLIRYLYKYNRLTPASQQIIEHQTGELRHWRNTANLLLESCEITTVRNYFLELELTYGEWFMFYLDILAAPLHKRTELDPAHTNLPEEFQRKIKKALLPVLESDKETFKDFEARYIQIFKNLIVDFKKRNEYEITLPKFMKQGAALIKECFPKAEEIFHAE